MLRTLWTPRWLGFTALALLALAVCFTAAWWQYTRTVDQLEIERAAAAQESDYPEVVTGDDLPPATLGRAVRLTGTGLPRARTLIRSRVDAAGEEGFLVVDGVRLPDGRVVALLQGWVSDPESAPPPVPGGIEVSGRVQPDENFYRDAPITAQGPLVTITGAGLAEQWRSVLADAPPGSEVPGLAPGYVTATTPVSGFERSVPVFGTNPDVPFPLQNAFYSLQWLIFAGLVVFVWGRGLVLDTRSRRGAGSGSRQEAAIAD